MRGAKWVEGLVKRGICDKRKHASSRFYQQRKWHEGRFRHAKRTVL